MAGKSKRSKLVLSDEDRGELEQLSRSRTLPHAEMMRSIELYGSKVMPQVPPVKPVMMGSGSCEL